MKQYKKDRFKRHKDIFLEDKTFQSWLDVKSEAGLMKVVATGTLFHICIVSFLCIF